MEILSLINDTFLNANSERVLLSFLVSFLATYIAIPIIIKVAKKVHLYDTPNERSSHTQVVPTLGGIGIFSAVITTLLIFLNFNKIPEMQFVVASGLILFFVGVTDDIMEIKARYKLYVQIAVSLLVIVLGDIRLTDFHGFLGIHHIGYLKSLLITTFVMIVIINCLNLIDGIDGLAAGISIAVALTFGLLFYKSKQWEYVVFCASIIGSLSIYFIYNVFGKKNKIFMGDTGSLILGLLISVITIHFNQVNIDTSIPHHIQNAPAISFAILVIPLFDTLRVFILRIKDGKSPFSPDKRHLHHLLLNIGFNHLNATLILVVTNVAFIILIYALRNHLQMIYLFVIIFVLASIFSYILFKLSQRKTQ